MLGLDYSIFSVCQDYRIYSRKILKHWTWMTPTRWYIWPNGRTLHPLRTLTHLQIFTVFRDAVGISLGSLFFNLFDKDISKHFRLISWSYHLFKIKVSCSLELCPRRRPVSEQLRVSYPNSLHRIPAASMRRSFPQPEVLLTFAS